MCQCVLLVVTVTRPDSLPRLWRYINLLLTYLLTPGVTCAPTHVIVIQITALSLTLIITNLTYAHISRGWCNNWQGRCGRGSCLHCRMCHVKVDDCLLNRKTSFFSVNSHHLAFEVIHFNICSYLSCIGVSASARLLVGKT